MLIKKITVQTMKVIAIIFSGFIPDFSKIDDCWNMFDNNNVDIYKLFGITKEEKEFIKNYYKIKYTYF